MHEMGIAQEIIRIAIDSIPEDLKNPKVTRVKLEVGKLSTVVPESLRFCYEIASAETVLAGSSLEIEHIPVRAFCKDCGYQWVAEQPVFICEKCQGGTVEILSGTELNIKSIEIDEQEQDSGQNDQDRPKIDDANS